MMSEGRGKKFLILKYFLMSSNAFGSMIGIFLVLFGISYPSVKFPGGYRGNETAAIAGGFIFFSLIGYCGAQHHVIYALILYSVIILVFISGNIIVWFVEPNWTLLDPESRTVYAVCGLLVILMIIAFALSWQIRRQSSSSPNRASSSSALHFNNSTGDVNVNSSSNQVSAESSPVQPLPPPIHRHQQQQQQKPQQQQPQQQNRQQQQQQQQFFASHSHMAPNQGGGGGGGGQQLIISTSGNHSIHRGQMTTTSIHGQKGHPLPLQLSTHQHGQEQQQQQESTTESGSSGSNLLNSPMTSPPPVPPAPSLEHLTSGHPSHLNISKINNSNHNVHHMNNHSSMQSNGNSQGGRDSSMQLMSTGGNTSQMTMNTNSSGNHSSSHMHPSSSASIVQIITNRPGSGIPGVNSHGHSHNGTLHAIQCAPSSTFH